MREQLEPLDFAPLDPYEKKNPAVLAVLRPLQQQVKDQGLWAAQLSPELGWQGYGQVQAGAAQRDRRPVTLGAFGFRFKAPDSGNAEIWRCSVPREEEALPAAAASTARFVVLLDDRTAGLAPTPACSPPAPSADGDSW